MTSPGRTNDAVAVRIVPDGLVETAGQGEQATGQGDDKADGSRHFQLTNQRLLCSAQECRDEAEGTKGEQPREVPPR
jgi:hypothetical protein